MSTGMFIEALHRAQVFSGLMACGIKLTLSLVNTASNVETFIILDQHSAITGCYCQDFDVFSVQWAYLGSLVVST